MLTEHLANCIRQQLYIVHGNVLIVAVSGGVDSLALADSLITLQSRFDFTVHIATLDHGLRGDEGAEDVTFVQRQAEKWGVTCHTSTVDTLTQAKSTGASVETTARRLRYTFLAQIARKVGANFIVTAHHADDQAETILMHLLRGAGLRGVKGMAIVAPVPEVDERDLVVFRPLLDVPKQTLIAYCTENGLIPRDDATNQDTAYFRNAIRHRLLPLMQELQPQASSALIRFAESAKVDDDFLQTWVDDNVVPVLIETEHRVKVPKVLFIGWHGAIQRRCILYMVNTVQHSDEFPTHEQIIHAVNVTQMGNIGAIAQFSGGIQLRVDYDDIVIEREDAPKFVDDNNFWLLNQPVSFTLNASGTTTIDGVAWKIHIDSSYREDAQAVIPITDGATIVLRTRQAGDRFALPGLNGHTQTLKKWMINQKIPRAIRHRIALLEINGDVVAILRKNRWIISENYTKTVRSVNLRYFSIIF